MKRKLLIAAAFILLAAAFSTAASAADAKIVVFASVLPHEYFIERIGGDRVDAQVLVGPGQSPHSFEPAPRQIANLSRARAYFITGIPFENGLIGKLSGANKNLAIVDLRKGIDLMNDPDEPGLDPHIWLDPKLAKTQARTICEALASIDPPGEQYYRTNLDAFLADLDRVDALIAATLAPMKGREFMVYHPAFGYFGKSYGLKQVAIETEGKEPGPRQVAKMVDLARKENIKVIFVQPQFSKKTAEVMARQIGGAVVPMDDLAKDYLHNLQKMAQEIKDALGAAGGTEGQGR